MEHLSDSIPNLALAVSSFLGAALGVWFHALIRGNTDKRIRLQERLWDEKYRLYQKVIEAVEKRRIALVNIMYDGRILSTEDYGGNTEQEGLRRFPEHKKWLDQDKTGSDELHDAEAGIELLLTTEAKTAVKKLSIADFRSMVVINMSYYDRLNTRMEALHVAKRELLDAAKADLGIAPRRQFRQFLPRLFARKPEA